RAEVGDRHSEEFHLVEWYRLGADLGPLLADVEAIVARVFDATGLKAHAPKAWQTARFRDVVADTCGARLRGDEEAAELLAAAPPELSAALASALAPAGGAGPAARTLLAWTAFFSAWSDMY